MTITSYSRSADGHSYERWQWLIIGGLFLLMLSISVLIAKPELARSYDIESSEADGLLALSLWLQEMSYDVAAMSSDVFSLSDADGRDADLLFIYPNIQNYTTEEAKTVAKWVERGGTLVLVGPTEKDFALIERFGVAPIPPAPLTLGRELVRQPLLPHPPDSWSTSFNRAELDLSNAPKAVPLLANRMEGIPLVENVAKRATVAIQPMGEGRIWHLSTDHPLTNQTLATANDGYLLPALLRNVPANSVVLFDTYHLYGSTNRTTSGTPKSLRSWLYQTSIGRALLFSSLLFVAYLLLQGIRLGPPLPIREEMHRREAAEYVVAMAGLQRRLGEPRHVADYERRRLKQALGTKLAIPTKISDEEFIVQWKKRSPNIESDSIRDVAEILSRLSQNPTERILVEMAARIDEYVRH